MYNCVSPYYFDWREKIDFQEISNKATSSILPAPALPPPLHQPKLAELTPQWAVCEFDEKETANPKKEEFPASFQKVFLKSDSIYTIQMTFSRFQRAA